ncbi:Glycerophosphoryl diester phosphodiesterase [Meinhardsimonia xiamenensis]|jgi:glycerophosphoryl diester phosphodiesterase|uniref:Glycerophosphoryl diester phosphodiesterase n=1 Tax=Meinhardsimonia xiamenensis TaxID=990712 RepID=A0A1G8XWK3_9RHOB|nr:glycerophosphodiester phosphodiesterase family protein [Meinhardsimonia xiamenensis]PRX37071.1 glycerophosphoryl diester phosphodiesterase [Meinhardsimonia xiamenensis]SDJ94881.1 Glycerophosphoryl diester phosphodiesterase [Meinhardsimonia xiamenensis]
MAPQSPPLHPAFLRAPIAHRGLHDLAAGRPENSRAAVAAAVAAGYGIEIDVQLTADGRAAVFHDYHLGRLTGETGPLRQRSAAELGRLGLTGGAEGVPMLEDIIALVAGRVPLLIEVKDQDGALGPDVGALEAAVAEAIKGYAGPVAVMSFNPHSIGWLGARGGMPALGLVTCAFDDDEFGPLPEDRRAHLRDIADFEAVGASFISHDKGDLGNPAVARLKARGVPVLCWTVHLPEEGAEARRIADNITFEGYLPAIPA